MSQWYRASAVGLVALPVNKVDAVDTSERVRAEWMSVRCAVCDAEKEKEKKKSAGFVGPF